MILYNLVRVIELLQQFTLNSLHS